MSPFLQHGTRKIYRRLFLKFKALIHKLYALSARGANVRSAGFERSKTHEEWGMTFRAKKLDFIGHL